MMDDEGMWVLLSLWVVYLVAVVCLRSCVS